MRAAVDASGNEPGSFVLTGSSKPRKELVHHSGAGRIAKLRMRTMTLAEMGLSSGAVSLAGLFEGRFEPQLVQQPLAPLALEWQPEGKDGVKHINLMEMMARGDGLG